MGLLQRWTAKLFDLAAKKGAERVLMLVAFSEAIFFPIPQDILLLPMGLANRERVFRLALICLVFSILGGITGYFLGYYFMELIGMPVMEFYGLLQEYQTIQVWYERYDAWAVAIAGVSPIPYKVCTLSAGAFGIDFMVFVLASIVSRGARFFVIAGLIYWKGEQARLFLEKRMDVIFMLFIVLVVLGFVLLKLL
ncbi:MAG: YqaA family protein [Desulfohalobiaceae bacterium]